MITNRSMKMETTVVAIGCFIEFTVYLGW